MIFIYRLLTCIFYPILIALIYLRKIFNKEAVCFLEQLLSSKSELCFNIICPVLEKGIFRIHKNDVHKIFKNNNCSCAFGRVC